MVLGQEVLETTRKRLKAINLPEKFPTMRFLLFNQNRSFGSPVVHKNSFIFLSISTSRRCTLTGPGHDLQSFMMISFLQNFNGGGTKGCDTSGWAKSTLPRRILQEKSKKIDLVWNPHTGLSLSWKASWQPTMKSLIFSRTTSFHIALKSQVLNLPPLMNLGSFVHLSHAAYPPHLLDLPLDFSKWQRSLDCLIWHQEDSGS